MDGAPEFSSVDLSFTTCTARNFKACPCVPKGLTSHTQRRGRAPDPRGQSLPTGTGCSRVARVTDDSDREWIQRRMAPSCKAHGWNPSAVVSHDRFVCRYTGQGTVRDSDGSRKRVYNPWKQWSGRLASCAEGSPESMSIPDSTMDAVRRYAFHLAGGNEAELDPAQFLCRVESLPIV